MNIKFYRKGFSTDFKKKKKKGKNGQSNGLAQDKGFKIPPELRNPRPFFL